MSTTVNVRFGPIARFIIRVLQTPATHTIASVARGPWHKEPMLRIRYAVILLLALPATALAQSGRAQVNRDSYHDVSPPLREIPPVPHVIGALEAEPVRRIPSPRIPSFGPDPVLQAPTSATTEALAPTTVANFD